MGWYDANPVNLNPLTPVDTAKKWVEYLGDTDRVLALARADYEKGEYQWVAQVTKELVYADPANQAARELCADALEQLGYQSESGTWRNAYLTGAMELRQGNLSEFAGKASGGLAVRQAMTTDMILDFIGIATDSAAAKDDDLTINLCITDTGEHFFLKRTSGVLLVYPDAERENADSTLSCTRLQLLGLMMGSKDAIAAVRADGDSTAPVRLVKYITPFSQTFNIVEP
jgi:alkyl sulfatase BDS1-like metallo-beta-lactamase superfamily hydrolase